MYEDNCSRVTTDTIQYYHQDTRNAVEDTELAINHSTSFDMHLKIHFNHSNNGTLIYKCA